MVQKNFWQHLTNDCYQCVSFTGHTVVLGRWISSNGLCGHRFLSMFLTHWLCVDVISLNGPYDHRFAWMGSHSLTLVAKGFVSICISHWYLSIRSHSLIPMVIVKFTGPRVRYMLMWFHPLAPVDSRLVLMWWSHPFLSLPHLLYWYVGTSYLTRNAQCRSLNATQISIWISSLQWPVVTGQKHVMCVKKLNCVLYTITKTNRRRESPGLEMLKNITCSDAVTEAKRSKRGNCN